MKTARSFRLFDLLRQPPDVLAAASLQLPAACIASASEETAVAPRPCVPPRWRRPLAWALFSSPANATNDSRPFLNGHIIEVPYK